MRDPGAWALVSKLLDTTGDNSVSRTWLRSSYDIRLMIMVPVAYFPYDSPCLLPSQKQRVLVVYAVSCGLEHLIGYVNLQHICWASSKFNLRGEKLFHFISPAGAGDDCEWLLSYVRGVKN